MEKGNRMLAQCPACAPGRGRAEPRAPWVALVSGLLAALLPKCPLCVAAWLSFFGVTLGAAGMALEVLRPIALAVCAAALGVSLVRMVRTLERPAAGP